MSENERNGSRDRDGTTGSRPDASGNGGADGELLREMERRAEAEHAPVHEAETGELNLIRELKLDPEADPEKGRDATLGGYMEKHDRPAAFEGSDGQPYTVDLDVEDTGEPVRPWAAFLVFIRWAATGAGIMDHVESDDVARADTEAEARAAALELSLHDVKHALDAAIARKQELLEDLD